MIAAGSDHGGYELKLKLIEHLKKRGFEVEDMGCFDDQSCDYPDYARKVCAAVLEGKAEKGLLVCGTGIGMSITANRFPGIRAAVLTEEFSAKATREHNDANVICLGARVIDEEKAIKLLDIFLDTPFSFEARHERRIAKIEQ